jgi:hypothetical protein
MKQSSIPRTRSSAESPAKADSPISGSSPSIGKVVAEAATNSGNERQYQRKLLLKSRPPADQEKQRLTNFFYKLLIGFFRRNSIIAVLSCSEPRHWKIFLICVNRYVTIYINF